VRYQDIAAPHYAVFLLPALCCFISRGFGFFYFPAACCHYQVLAHSLMLSLLRRRCACRWFPSRFISSSYRCSALRVKVVLSSCSTLFLTIRFLYCPERPQPVSFAPTCRIPPAFLHSMDIILLFYTWLNSGSAKHFCTRFWFATGQRRDVVPAPALITPWAALLPCAVTPLPTTRLRGRWRTPPRVLHSPATFPLLRCGYCGSCAPYFTLLFI